MHRVRGAVLSALAASVYALVLPDTTDATTMIRFSTEELTVTSELVAEGTVTEIDSRFHTEHEYIYTYVTIDVAQVLKGSSTSSSIVLEELGGTANGMHVRVPGAPEFEVGERVIVFTEWKDNTGHYRTVAMAQGKFSVVEDDATGRLHVVRPEVIESSFAAADDGSLDSTIDPATGRRDYEQFVATVKAWADRLVAPGGGR